MVAEGGIVVEEALRLLAGPALRVDAGVDHQPRRAPHLIGEHAEPLVGGAVEAHLVSQPLAVECPAFAIGGNVGVAAERRQRGVLGGERDLEGVAGRAFVQRQRGELGERA